MFLEEFLSLFAAKTKKKHHHKHAHHHHRHKHMKKIPPTSEAPVKEQTARDMIVRFAHWGVVHTDQIHYAEARPIPHVHHGLYPHLPLTTDCSGFVTMAYQFAGAPDPNGQNYDGEGYTGTLLSHGKKVARPKPGDLVVYGSGEGHHTAIIISVSGSKIMTASHGNESGPLFITTSEEAKFQPPGITFLSYLP